MTIGPDTALIRERFAFAVSSSGRTVAEIETSSGMKRDRLRDFLNERKASISLGDAAAVATELGQSLNWLAGCEPERAATAVGRETVAVA